MFKQLPVQTTEVLLLRTQDAEELSPGVNVVFGVRVVMFFPSPEKHIGLTISCDPRFVIITELLLTEITSIYVPAHFVWFVEADSTLCVVVSVNPVSHRLIMPPIATVKAIKRTTATIGLMAFDFIVIFINLTFGSL